MPIKQTLQGSHAPVRIWTDELDSATRQQLLNVASLPIVYKHVAAMPDVHLGKGATVGSVIATKGAIIPAAVSVDIGCGMCAARTTLTANDLDEKRLTAVFHQISRDVPLGFEQHSPDRAHTGQAQRFARGLRSITDKHPGLMKHVGKHSDWTRQLGTLGGGNHFIEICLDEQGFVWVLLHSGSRGIGNAIGSYFIQLAREEMLHLDAQLPDRDLAYLTEGTVHFDDYVEAVRWAQDYAAANRALMLETVLDALRRHCSPFDVSRQAVQCFAGETVVMTYEGNRPIRELAGGTHKLLTEGGRWVDAPVRSFGTQNLMKLTLSRSGVTKVVYATPEHRWIVCPLQRTYTLEKTTSELKAKDRLAVSFPMRRPGLFLDPEGIARGYVFGDGSQSSPNRSRAVFYGQKDQPMLLFFRAHGFGLQPRPHPKWNFVIINGLPAPWKLAYPDLYSEPSYLYGWLSGYFAADGDIDKTGRPTLASSRKEDLEYVRALCTRIGIGTFGIRTRVRQGYAKAPCPLYLVGLMRKDLSADFFQVPAHRARFEATVSNVAERRAWNVVSVERTDRWEEVYCAVVEGTHSFTLEDNLLTRNCHHNYVEREHHFGEDVWVTRKGAIRAGSGELGIIPGSMGAKSYIVRGKGNPESFESSAHGAGRRLSRNAAAKQFTEKDLREQTQGIVCRKDRGVVDEIPAAYKPIEKVMANQDDLVEVVHTLRQLLCVKG